MGRKALATGVAVAMSSGALIAYNLIAGPAMAGTISTSAGGTDGVVHSAAAPTATLAQARRAAVPVVRMCMANQVELSPGRAMSRSGHWALILRLYNKSATTCRMQGWPLVFGLDGNANLSGTAAHTMSGYFGGVTGDNPPVVDLAARGTASALVEGTSADGGHGKCTNYQGLEVTVPDGDNLTKINDAELSTDGSFVSCDRLQVHPVVLGTTGRQG